MTLSLPAALQISAVALLLFVCLSDRIARLIRRTYAKCFYRYCVHVEKKDNEKLKAFDRAVSRRVVPSLPYRIH